MARKIHTFKYTSKELDDLLEKIADQPFVVYHDENAGLYRFFPDEERMNTWVQAYEDGVLTPDIDALQFIDPITAPSPNTINIAVANDNQYILESTEGSTIDFTFETLDSNGVHVAEPVDIYYTFRSSAGTKTTSVVYNADFETATTVNMSIDKYISLGKNTISIMVKGRATGATKTVVATCNVIRLRLTSTFDFAAPREPNVVFEVPYKIEGDGDRVVEFYVDGSIVANPGTSSIEGDIDKIQTLSVTTPGKHTLQILAKSIIGGNTYRSKLLYFEFVAIGQELTTTMITEEFDSTQDVFTGDTMPGLHGEQYVIKRIAWAYYSSDPNKQHNITIQWRLFNPGGDNIPIATRTADVAEASVAEAPDPIAFMPTESGTYHLQALIGNVVINDPDYTISIIPNTTGIIEATNGLTMKLSGLGRSNSEPVETLASWYDRGYSTTFTNQPWNNNSGWIDNALVLNGGATAIINNKPFASEVSPQTRSGCTFEIDFETFNVLSEDAEVLRIGLLGGANLVITGSKAVLTTGVSNKTIVSRFKADERIKIAFVIYPRDRSIYPMKMFVYNNGVMSGVVNYNVADNFDMGSRADTESQVGMIQLGNSDGEVGIKIYYIRTYDNYISMYEELNNYFIDSGENLTYLVADNDIYSTGKFIDVDKLESTITTVKLTGALNEIIGTGSKDNKLTCKLEVISPTNSNINLYCDKAQVNKAGQSTLEKPVPSFHVRLDKIKENVCYDRDGKVYPKNRWAFREGNVPEKKFRLQANYMDSSGCHNAAFFRLINEVYPKVQIGGQNVLRIPCEQYAIDNYPAAMAAAHQAEYPEKVWKFPYTINICPDSIPCIVVWRPTEDDSYRFLGQYVIMEEKKSNYANGMHSIYSGIDIKGNEDPFGFKSDEKTGIKLWDNANCHQFEFLRSASMLDFLCDDSQWNSINPSTGTLVREDSFELIYPDEDDLTSVEIDNEWEKFYEEVVHPICSTYDSEHPETAQAAFNDLFYGSNPKLDRWGFAAYYCLVMRHACSDSLVRNMELVTYDGQKWTPKWWDVDMQCGLQQSGACDINPTSDRDTKISATMYALSGRIIENGVLKSSWLWDGLEGCPQFMEDVKTMDAALYEAGWRYSEITKIQDEEYVDSWSNALYNESGVTKYLTYGGDELNYISLQGDRTPHRHWFLRTSFDYFDALNVCGEYTVKACKAKTAGISSSGPNNHIYIVPSSDSYFGWRYTTDIVESGVFIAKGDTGYLTISRPVTSQEFIVILGANKISEIDFSEIFTNFFAAIDFSDAYDDILGSQFKKIILGSGDGVAKTKLNNGLFNTNSEANVIGGIALMSKLEYLDIQGMHSFTAIDLTHNGSIKKFYAAGTNITTFDPASGSNLTEVELPTTINSMTMNGCNLEDSNHNCLIKWYETNYTNNVPTSVTLTTIPSSLISLSFNAMGTDLGVKELVLDWINAVYDDFGDEGLAQRYITCANVNWTDVSIHDLLLLSKIPSNNNRRRITGYIRSSDTFSSAEVVAIQNAFGEGVFTNNPGVPLRIDASDGFVLACPDEILAGTTITVSGIAFPIASAESTKTYILGTYPNNDDVFQACTLQPGGYYAYKGVKLYPETGVIIVDETQDPDYYVGVRGRNSLGAADTVKVKIKKRTYPTNLDFNITYTEGKDVFYDAAQDSWYVTSSAVAIDITVESTPEEVTGTLSSFEWIIDSSITSKFDSFYNEERHYQLYVSNPGDELTTGKIKYVEHYAGNYDVYREVTFKFQNPQTAILQVCNPILQEALYEHGIAMHSSITYQHEAWRVTDLNALGIFDSGSQLVHLGEFNVFENLNMSVLDLSNCSLLGTPGNIPVQLEDDENYYVDVLPRRDQTLAFDFEEIDMSNTHLKGINIKQGNVLETITYGDYTEEVVLVNQTALTTLNIPTECEDTLDKLIIEGCNSLVEITEI